MSERAVRTYSVAEANAALEEVAPLVARIVALFQDIPELQEGVQIANYKTSREDAGPDLETRYEEAKRAQYDAEMELARSAAQLESRGVVLKDPQQGLIDFYSVREGELVELCWKLGEAKITHWHRIGEGFSGRQPL